MVGLRSGRGVWRKVVFGGRRIRCGHEEGGLGAALVDGTVGQVGGRDVARVSKDSLVGGPVVGLAGRVVALGRGAELQRLGLLWPVVGLGRRSRRGVVGRSIRYGGVAEAGRARGQAVGHGPRVKSDARLPVVSARGRVGVAEDQGLCLQEDDNHKSIQQNT
jgi:hypothetical protein